MPRRSPARACTAWRASCRPGVSRGHAASVYAANLAWAAEQARQAGVKPVIEPINHRDIPGYFLNTRRRARRSSRRSGRDRLGLQFDLYHCQIDRGRHRQAHGAAHAGDRPYAGGRCPGRNEPGTGEVNWRFVFRRMDELGFRGWIGCEYRPAGDTEAGLQAAGFAPYKEA